MAAALKGICTFLVAVAAFYATLWLVGGLLLPAGTPIGPRLLLSVAVAILAGRWFWTSAGFSEEGPARAIVNGALLVGAIGFCAGFFGPLILAPEANQGPLLGLLITGPLGFLAGGIGGFAWWWRRHRGHQRPGGPGV
jgi:hypothetical protein